ncbi:hypothetical protein CYG68_19260 [Morganella morganii]|uniref:Uncharacterized protein n=1 Tax=Morganella morganii TaxID=582 RepID=A0A8I0PY59_MORMO|nr:hypothetical protein [Morganella morganii]MBE8614506.1 hypothetical protein [Morganella morganii]
MASDLVIIPVTASPLDFAASTAILTVIEARNDLQPVKASTKSVHAATMMQVLKDSIQEAGFKAPKTGTTQRQSYIKTMLDGGTVFETSDSQAKGEIDNIVHEILEILNEK